MQNTKSQSCVPDETKHELPISCYVVKVASRCNLNCKYCYMYNLGDKTYLDQPAVMPREVVDAFVLRVREHCRAHSLDRVSFIFHGGEPLLAGQDFFKYFVNKAHESLVPDVKTGFAMQTNATLLTREWMETLYELEIGVGISLDGPKAINDANRVDHSGDGSHDRAVESIKTILSDSRLRSCAGNILCVVNLDADPLEVYRHFRSLGAKGANFLLPDGTHDHPPPGIKIGSEATPYADWLIPIFDEWFAAQETQFSIRLFETIIGLVFGMPYCVDSIGGREVDLAVIETDGGLEPVDVLKVCGHGFTKLGLNVLTNPIDDLYKNSLFRLYMDGAKHLGQTCKKCPIVNICGGGYLPHRYSSSDGFSNPSVYCKDLTKLISHVQSHTVNSLSLDLREQLGLITISDLRATTVPATRK